MDLIKGSIRQPITVVVGILFVLLAGMVASKKVPIQMTPEVEDTVIAVTTTWENASPQEIESEIVDPQEEKLQGLSNLRSISSLNSRGSGVIRLEFNNGVDKEVALREVSDKLREVESYPENVDEPVIEASDPDSSDYIAWYVLTSDNPNYDIREFHDIADEKIKPVLERVSGISEVNIIGGLEREVQIRFDALKLAQYKMTTQDLYDAIRKANVNFSGGALQQGKSDVRIRAVGRFSNIKQVENYVIRNTQAGPVYIRNVAEVVETFKEPTSFVRVKGKRCLAFNFQKEVGGNVLEIMKNLATTIESFHTDGGVFKTESARMGIEGKMSMDISYDSTLYINQALALVEDNLYVGGFLAIMVLLLFLRSFRSVGIIALAIPVSMIGTIVLMVVLGRTINVVSLAGMAFAVGMVVDNSIVVLENIYRHLEMGKKGFDAAYSGTKEVAGAVLASTLTTVVVFLPILLIQDQVGQLFRDIAISIMISVSLSYIIAITLIPSAAALLLKSGKIKKKSKDSKKAFLYRILYTINGSTIARLAIIIIFVTVTIIGIVKLIPPLDYLPAGNRNITFGIMITPPGYNIDQMEKLADRLEDTVRPFWEGREDRPSFPDPSNPDQMMQPAEIEQYFVVSRGGTLFHGAISASSEQAADTVALFNGATTQEKLPGVYGFAFQFPLFRLGGTSGSAVKMNLTGSNLEQVANAAGAIFGTIMQSGQGTLKPDPANFNVKAPEMQIFPNSLKLAESKMTHTDLGLSVAANSDGLFAGDYDFDGDLIDLKLINKSSLDDMHINALEKTPIATPSGKVIPLNKVGDFKWVEAPEQIKRVGRERAVTLEFTAPKGMPLESAVELLKASVKNLREVGAIAPDVNVNLEGTAGKLKEIKTTLMGDGTLSSIIGSSLFMAAAAVYLLMCVLFQSWIQPFIIMFTVPLATFGGFVGLAIVHAMSLGDKYMPVQNLDVLTILGFIILAGVVVNNAILIVAQANNLMIGIDDSGNKIEQLPAREAISESVNSRIRPILMSMMTSIGGMLPLVITPGSGSELYRGLGAVIVGGMILSTLFTLFLVPVLMSLIMDLQGKFSKYSSNISKAAVISIILLLSGCVNYQPEPNLKEVVTIPNKWQQPKLPEVKGDLKKWWTSFNDPTLTKLIEVAKKNNSDILIGLQHYLKALTVIEGKEADLLPITTIDGSLSRNRFSNSLKDNFQPLEAINDIRSGISTNWEIDFFGRIQDSIKSSKFSALSKREDLDLLKTIIAAEVAKSYFNYLSLGEQEKIAKKNIEIQRQNLNLVQARVDAGEATMLEVSETETLLHRTRTNLQSVQKQQELTLNALNLLVGSPPGTIKQEYFNFTKLPKIEKILPIGLPVDVIRNRPDIRSSEYTVAANAANLKIAEKEYLPKFSLNGSIGLNSSYLQDFLRRDSRTYSFGPSFNWRILDTGNIESAVQQQKATLQESLEVYRKSVLTALKEIEDSLVSYKKEKKREGLLKQTLEASVKSLELSKGLYREGLRDYLSVITAMIAKQRTEQELILSAKVSIDAVIDLYKALGGGQ
ncbi:MAG: efflux RND transporter permease subunit [Lentisphaeraceae bacterium]|nr:efflux RND transporter permease subunit [Lentisphaeraceae bacterium]